jgi:hypothetical protein
LRYLLRKCSTPRHQPGFISVAKGFESEPET